MDRQAKQQMRRVIRDCHGNLAEVARRFGISREAARQRLDQPGASDLRRLAAQLRDRHGIPGSRGALSSARDRQRIEAALKRHKTQAAAARALRMGRTRLQRAMTRLGITDQRTH